jgi:HAD superfamily phosphatase (TIGR01668 family)
MLSLVTPHIQLASVLDLGLDSLRRFGLDGLLLDVDCTLKDHGATVFPEPIKAWTQELRAGGARLCLLSNGRAGRIGGLAAQLDVPFVARAFKPFPRGCHAGLDKLGLPPACVGVVGDQIFADILAGRLAGLFTILVRPTSPVEPWFTRLKRPLERRVLRRLNGQSISERSLASLGSPGSPPLP